MDKFLKILKQNLKEQFPGYRVEYLIQTLFSLKVNIHLEKNYFISIRYNGRNGRMDMALIAYKQRIFGYDNLKTWHYHPYGNPSSHIPCEPPSLDKMLSDTKKYYEIDKQKQ